MNFGAHNQSMNTLKDIRVKRGLTQGEAASLVGVQQATWSKWENGSTVPTEDNLKRIEEVFGLTNEEVERQHWLAKVEDSPMHLYTRALLREVSNRSQRDILILGLGRLADELKVTRDSLENSVNEAVRSGHVVLEGREGDIVVLRVVH